MNVCSRTIYSTQGKENVKWIKVKYYRPLREKESDRACQSVNWLKRQDLLTGACICGNQIKEE
nr:MAG TPA: hypothetical protein [Caudoviricetes sp.]DAT90952.1 MAG TPA: hypothetical protein [Caudoviricetes sp.]